MAKLVTPEMKRINRKITTEKANLRPILIGQMLG